MAVRPDGSSNKRLRAMGVFTILLAIAPMVAAFSQGAAAAPPPPVWLSTFEIDGDLDVDGVAPATDWTTVSNRTSQADATKGTPDDTFSNSTHEDDVATGVVGDSYPDNKSDLTRTYAAHEKIGDDIYLYLGWQRKVDPTGSVDFDFEINRASQGTVPTVPPGGPWNLVRTSGDLLVTYELTGGGTVPTIYMRTWLAAGDAGTCEAGNAKPCWSESSTPLDSQLAKGAVNTPAITDPITGQSLSPRTFGELGLNLSGLGIFVPGQCTHFGSTYVKSRSSGNSFQSVLQDFVKPATVQIANCGTVEIIKDVKGGTSARDFSFTSNAPAGGTTLGSFVLDDDADPTRSNTFTKVDVKPGTYTVTEAATVGWEIDAINCSSGSTGNTTTGVATLVVVPGATTTCTFVNEDLLPTISATKAGSPSSRVEPGGTFTFTVRVTNTSTEPVTLTSLVDSPYGDLLDDAANTQISNSDCADNTVIPAGDTYECSFDTMITAKGGTSHQDTVTATAVDSDANSATATASATVNITDSIPTIAVTKKATPTTLAEPGGTVTFEVGVKNNSTVESLTLTSLVDNPYGDLLDDAGNPQISNSTCVDNTTIAIGATYTCSFDASVTGNPGSYMDTVTATATDDEGNTPSGTASATVSITDVAPTMTVAKSGMPVSRPEPGGSFTFKVDVTNTSGESITITSMVDNPYGDLLDDAANNAISGSTCTKATIAAGATYSCSFAVTITGQPGLYSDTVAVQAADDDGTKVNGTASAQVAITDVMPTIAVTKSPAPASMPEPGGAFTFTVSVQNTSTVEAVTLRSLVDAPFGDVLDDAANDQINDSTCVDNTVINPGATYSCSFKADVTGQPGRYLDTVTAGAEDDDGNDVDGTATATVILTDVTPTVAVTKSASPTVIRSGQTSTYTYHVTTTSSEAVSVVVTDDKCSPVTFVGGDSDNDGKLDAGETWSYTCTATLTETTVNTVTAVATDDDGNSAQAQAQARVEVITPSIVIDKSADPESGQPGTPITYTYVVTTPGEPLTDVTVTDDQCSPVTYVGGDDGDGVLESGERWTYTCSKNADASTPTNIATAVGVDRTGTKVEATDKVTVAVVLPAVIVAEAAPVDLPRTGAETDGLAKLAGSLVLLGCSLLFVSRRGRNRPAV